jgi:hypothetical protein
MSREAVQATVRVTSAGSFRSVESLQLGADLADTRAILEDRERPHYEHRLAA